MCYEDDNELTLMKRRQRRGRRHLVGLLLDLKAMGGLLHAAQTYDAQASIALLQLLHKRPIDALSQDRLS